MSSKRAVRRKQCGHKRKYEDRATADQTRLVLFRLYGERLDAYRCRRCGMWHIGHAPMWVQVKLGRAA